MSFEHVRLPFIVALLLSLAFHPGAIDAIRAQASKRQSTSNSLLTVSRNMLSRAKKPNQPRVEPFIVANPANPNHLVSATIVIESAKEWKVELSTSVDRGKTWSVHTPEGLDQFTLSGDPWLIWSPDGMVYFSCIAIAQSRNGQAWSVFVYRSSTDGRTWSQPTRLPGDGGYDHPVLITAGQGHSLRLGVVATLDSSVVVFRSDDAGKSFSAPQRFNFQEGNVHLGGAVALDESTIVLTYARLDGDGQSTPMRIYATASRDGGKTFSEPIKIGEGVFNGFPLVAADLSSHRVYCVWTHRGLAYDDIYLAHSENYGMKWSTPIRVNTLSSSARGCMYPVLAVNPYGILVVSWHEQRSEPNHDCSAVYVTASLDGGSTFLKGVLVTPQILCSDLVGNRVGGFEVAKRWPQGGDYSGITALGDRMFMLIWSDSRTGVFRNWTAAARIIG